MDQILLVCGTGPSPELVRDRLAATAATRPGLTCKTARFRGPFGRKARRIGLVATCKTAHVCLKTMWHTSQREEAEQYLAELKGGER
jgi:hypothetical protein